MINRPDYGELNQRSMQVHGVTGFVGLIQQVYRQNQELVRAYQSYVQSKDPVVKVLWDAVMGEEQAKDLKDLMVLVDGFLADMELGHPEVLGLTAKVFGKENI